MGKMIGKKLWVGIGQCPVKKVKKLLGIVRASGSNKSGVVDMLNETKRPS